MRNIRIYTEADLSVSTRIVLPKETSHHLLRVLRCRRGDEITLFNGKGGSFAGRIVADSNHVAEIEIMSFDQGTSTPVLTITLALGISRSLHMDYAVQKSTELGVSTIVPLFTERSNVKLDPNRVQSRLEHWKKVIIHACEQSHRDTLPLLNAPQPLHQWLSQDPNTTRFLFTPEAQQSLAAINGIDGRGVSLLIGPEGGLTGAEQSTAEKQGYVPIKLGPRTLRTETAVVAAVSALQVLWGDLR